MSSITLIFLNCTVLSDPMTFTPNSPEFPKARIEGEILCARTFPLTIEIIDLSSLKIFGYINENEILDISLDNKVEVTILDEKVTGMIEYILSLIHI